MTIFNILGHATQIQPSFGFLVFFIGVNHVYSVKEDFNLKIGEEKKLNNYKINFKSLQVKFISSAASAI